MFSVERKTKGGINEVRVNLNVLIERLHSATTRIAEVTWRMTTTSAKILTKMKPTSGSKINIL